MTDEKKMTLAALQQAKGDNLERATHSFRGMSESVLDEQFGQSGQTHREVLAEYQDHRDRVNKAIEWVEGL